jgi:hypothetical protein
MKTNKDLLEASQTNGVAKYTKGEWRMIYPAINAPNEFIIGDCDGFTLASVYGALGTPNDMEEAEANAKLIAAAPDLLEALVLANSILDRMSSEYAMIANKHANFTRGESNIIERAIEKATK